MTDKKKRIEKLKLMQAQKIQTQKIQTIKLLSLTIKVAEGNKPTDKSVGFSNILLAKGGEKYKL